MDSESTLSKWQERSTPHDCTPRAADHCGGTFIRDLVDIHSRRSGVLAYCAIRHSFTRVDSRHEHLTNAPTDNLVVEQITR